MRDVINGELVPICVENTLVKLFILTSFFRSVESTLRRKTTFQRHLVESSFFYDDVPPLDDLSPNDKLTPPVLSQWIRAKGESFGSVYLVNFHIKDANKSIKSHGQNLN